MLRNALLAATLLFSGCSLPVQPREPRQDESFIKVREGGVRYGYAGGKTSQGDLAVLTVEAHVGFDVNHSLNIDRKFGNFTSTVAVVANSIQEPDVGIEVGLLPGLKYSYPITDWLEPYIEAQSGPIYYGIDTVEQGKAGFDFLNQFGGGLEFKVKPGIYFTAGYRFRHISHANFRSGPNREINSHGGVVGFVFRH